MLNITLSPISSDIKKLWQSKGMSTKIKLKIPLKKSLYKVIQHLLSKWSFISDANQFIIIPSQYSKTHPGWTIHNTQHILASQVMEEFHTNHLQLYYTIDISSYQTPSIKRKIIAKNKLKKKKNIIKKKDLLNVY